MKKLTALISLVVALISLVVAMAATVGSAIASPTEKIVAPTIAWVKDAALLSLWNAIDWLESTGLMKLRYHADTAFQTQYRQEFIAGFEQHVSLLRDTVTTEAEIKGNTCVFLVADSGNAEATTRGVNGLIPARADNLTQNSCVLSEWHDLVRKTGFNVFASQGNQRAIMQMTSMGVINRKIDQQIITELNTGTVTAGGTGTIMTVSLFQNATVKLQNASVPWDSRITFLCCPATLAYLEQAPEFTNAQYVDMRPYAGQEANWRDKPMAYRWKNALIVSHPNLPGKGTTAESSEKSSQLMTQPAARAMATKCMVWLVEPPVANKPTMPFTITFASI